MTHNSVQAFRKTYRAQMSPRYSPWSHIGFVFSVGGLFIILCLSNLSGDVTVSDLLMSGVALILFNVGEYFVHRKLGHKKQHWLKRVGALFYQRHTGDHHSFFGHQSMAGESRMDWRVTFFPAWLVLVIIALAMMSGVAINQLMGVNASRCFMSGLVFGYVLYEWLHFCYHLPDDHWLVALLWIKQMRHLHRIHHDRGHMQSKNFNLTFPLTDIVMGTFLWVPMTEALKDHESPCE
ncbi:MAG: sterol desaturase family protein [Pseudomonadota bacterium]